MSQHTAVSHAGEELQLLARTQHSRDVGSGMLEAVRSGRLPGRAPLGYLNVRRGSDRLVVPDPAAAPLVQQAFFWAAEGGYPLRKMLEVMTERGLRSRKGVPLSVAGFWKLLTNPFYCGSIRYRGELCRGAHAPLVDRRTFERAQERLAAKRRSPGRSGGSTGAFPEQPVS